MYDHLSHYKHKYSITNESLLLDQIFVQSKRIYWMKEKTIKKISQRFWLIVVSKDHVIRGTTEKIAQACHGRKTWISKPSKGDGVLFYSPKIEFLNTKKSNSLMKFTAFGYFQDDEVYVEKMDEGEFHRRKVDYGTINREVNIKDYLDALEFIKDPKNCGVEVRNGMRMISKNDFELIKNLMLE
jgi:hypothetical protein